MEYTNQQIIEMLMNISGEYDVDPLFNEADAKFIAAAPEIVRQLLVRLSEYDSTLTTVATVFGKFARDINHNRNETEKG